MNVQEYLTELEDRLEEIRAACDDNLDGVLSIIEDAPWNERTGSIELPEDAWMAIQAMIREIKDARDESKSN